MSNTEIIVYKYTDDTNTSYSLYESLDITSSNDISIPIPLTFSIADIRNPEKRNTAFSKTITLPGTKKNNKLFGSIFEITVDTNFNPNKKVSVIIKQDGYEQINGILQLKKITKTVNDDSISYEVVVFGQFSNIFYNLGDTKLCDLDISEYDHTYEFDTIIPSWNDYIETTSNPSYVNWETGYTTTFLDTEWTNGLVTLITNGNHQFNIGDSIWVEKDDISLNYYYNASSIVIDIPSPDKITINKPWGENSTLESGTVYVKNPTGEGYVYPLINYGEYHNNLGFKYPEDLPFAPSIYTKTIVDKIFEKAGFKYQSNFFNSPYFKRLIIPYNGEQLVKTTLQLQEQEFRAGIASGNTIQYNTLLYQAPSNNNPLNFNLDTPSNPVYPDLYDNNNNYNTTSPQSTFISQYTTKMKFETILNFTLNINPNNLSQPFYLWGGNGNTGKVIFNSKIILNRGGILTTIGLNTWELLSVNPESGGVLVIPNTGTTTSNQTLITTSNEVELLPNDIVFTRVDLFIVPVPPQSNPQQLTYVTGGVPQYPLTNFRITVNNNRSRFYNIVTDNTLRNGDTVVMNNILPCNIRNSDILLGLIKMYNLYIDDVKGEINRLKIEPRNEYYQEGNLIDWTNKLDISQNIVKTPLSELLTKDYKLSYKEDKDYLNEAYTQVNTDRIYGDKLFTIDNDFLKGETTIQPLFSPTPNIENSNGYISFPSIYKQTIEDNTTKNVNTKSNIRILYYGGLKSYIGYTLSSSISKFIIDFNPSQIQLYYPYCGMDDDPYIPFKTLNYSSPLNLFYQMQYYTNDNLFNRYWRNYFLEITNKNSRKVECSIYLTPKDIYELDFKNLIYIDGQYYRLNKIINFNPIGNTTTRVELINVINSIEFSTQTKNITNGNNNIFDDTLESLPFNYGARQFLPNELRVIGINNSISEQSYNILINGDDNFVSQGVNNVSIIGSNNVSVFNSSNVSVIGTNNVVVTESNTTIINGVKYSNGVLVTPFNVADGMIDDVYLLSPITTNVIDGSIDTAYNIGSSLPLNVIDGSIDITYQV
jgi:hypothetical protein